MILGVRASRGRCGEQLIFATGSRRGGAVDVDEFLNALGVELSDEGRPIACVRSCDCPSLGVSVLNGDFMVIREQVVHYEC